MSEYEFLTAIDSARSFAVQAAMGFFTVFGAYVLTAHFAGKSFSKFAAGSISVLYTLFLTGPITGIITNIFEAARLEVLYFSQYPTGGIVQHKASPEVLIMVMVAPLFLGWVSSLVYMHGYVRKTP